ncbi:MAG: AAA family ATPase [Parvularculaceae bacterium]
MYEEFYGLTEKPFSIQPDPSFLFWGRGHRLAYAMLEYGVVNQAGISVITGEVGCGKTTLVHRLLDQLSDTHTVALLSNIQSGRGELLSWVLMGFGEPFAGKTHVEMFAQLQSFFIREYGKGKRVVLIIDEAQNLSVDMLEELRMLSNINAGKDQLLQLILVGQPQLKDLLSRPDMLQLAQRIGSDFHLTPLSREEVHSYIDTRLTIAGARRRVFSEKAMDLVAEQSRGVPRVINIIADTALVYAFSAQDEIVSEETIRAVIRDKIDYGVFGLASNPDVKLTEWRESRAASGFLREVAKDARAEAEAAPVDQGARLTRNMGVRLVAAEAASALAPDTALAVGGPSLYSHTEFSTPAFPAPTPFASAGARPAALPIGAALTAPADRPDPKPAMAPSAAADPAREVLQRLGVVIVGGDLSVAETMQSLPEGANFVIAAAADELGLAAAKGAGVNIVEIADGPGGGRARNAGYRRLKKEMPDVQYVQFLDAGVMLAPGWLDQAEKFMARRPEVAVLEGRLDLQQRGATALDRVSARSREKPAGEVQSAGSNALYRAEAFETVGGFRGDIVADATADLCIRLRRRGAHVWRSEALMASAEPQRLTFKTWRREASRNGFSYAAGAALHGAPPERFNVKEQSRAFFWGGLAPAAIILAALGFAIAAGAMGAGTNAFAGVATVIVFGLTLYGLKITMTSFGAGGAGRPAWTYGLFATIGHFPEFQGVMRYWFGAAAAPRAKSADKR